MEQPRTNLERPSRAPLYVLLVALAAAGVGAWLWLRSPQKPAPAAPQVAEAPGAAPASAGPAEPVDVGRAPGLLELVSANALFRGCLAKGEPVRSWALATENLAGGLVPRAPLACLAPAGAFAAVRGRRGYAISPESYRRFDAAGEAVASIDAQALARAYRELHPAIEAAYRALGYPGASLDGATSRALHRIEAAPVLDGEIALVRISEDLYELADPRLEALGPLEKQLLRMGPANARKVQAKARELRAALGLAEAPAGKP